VTRERTLANARRVIVVDLGFGDAGKGTVTDYLVRELGATAVVRFNGGAQAGHTVVADDGREHTFAQFGAGTFVPGVKTFLSRHVVFHPTALLVEAEHLARAGVGDALARIHVSDDCLVTTPVHQAATRIRELARGGARHGSCGVGVGETVRDALRAPADALRARHLGDATGVERAVLRQQADKREELAAELRSLGDADDVRRERDVLTDPGIARAWAAQAARVAAVVGDDEALRGLLAGDDRVIFEGAQGVLLDEWVGFHPYTTWSTTTWENAEALLSEHASPHAAYRLGVLRTYATRHGAGPFPTEDPGLGDGDTRTTREHNVHGPWQGAFRTGWLDAVLARYAVAAAGAADGLALTHLDRPERGRGWPIATEYELGSHAEQGLFDLAPGGRARGLRVGRPRDLGHVEALGRALFHARPVYRVVRPTSGDEAPAVASAVEELLDARVVLTSAGPTASGKRLR
jgi:adenylosuccinate synthase